MKKTRGPESQSKESKEKEFVKKEGKNDEKIAKMGRKKIQIARIMDERNRHVSVQTLKKQLNILGHLLIRFLADI